MPPSPRRRSRAEPAASPRTATPPLTPSPRTPCAASASLGRGTMARAGSSPCLCLGSMRYVHVHCLNQWRSASANPVSFYQCEQCLYRYSMRRTKYAELLESPRLSHLATVSLMAIAISTAALTLGVGGAAVRESTGVETRVEQHFYNLVAFHPASPWDSGRLVSSVWGWRLDALVSGLLAVAAVGLALSVHDAWRANRHVSNSWMIGIVALLAAEGSRGMRLLAAIGLLHSFRAMLARVQRLAKAVLTAWGTTILEVRR